MNGSSKLSMVCLVHSFLVLLGGGVARECRAVYKRLIQLLAEKRKEETSLVAARIRRKISFALMKMIISVSEVQETLGRTTISFRPLKNQLMFPKLVRGSRYIIF